MRVSAVDLRDQARQLTQFVREVTGILNGGMRLADQLGGVRTFRFLDTAGPVLVSPPRSSVPAGIICLAVVPSRGDRSAVLSGASVTWTHSERGLLVSAVGGTTSGTEYDVTIAIVEG